MRMSGLQGLKLAYNQLSNRVNGRSQTAAVPMIIIHGLFGNKQNNRTLANYILEQEMSKDKDKYRDIYLVDVRNHGQSPIDPDMKYGSMSRDIERFVNDHNLGSCVMVGHSMGGKIAMRYSLDNPEYVHSLVCIENLPVKQGINHKFVEYLTLLQEICNDKSIKIMKQGLAKVKSIESNPLISQFLMTMLKLNSSTRSGLESKIPLQILKDSILDGSISDWNTDPHCQFKKPSLFLRGSDTDSSYLIGSPKNILSQCQYQFIRPELHTIPDSGHFCNVEKPRDCAAAITCFLSGNRQ